MNRRGVALVITLALMAVLIGVISVLAVSTIGDLRQSRASVQLLQARAAAEAGETYAAYILSTQAQTAFSQVFAPYNNKFLQQGGNPAQDWAIPRSDWGKVASSLEQVLNGNSTFDSLPSNALNNGAQVAIEYSISDFHGAAKSATSQTYVVRYKTIATATVNGGKRRVESQGLLQFQLGRPSLSQWLFLVDDAGGRNGFFPTGSIFNGPVHANHNWGFRGRPVFTDLVSTADDGAWYYRSSENYGGGNGSCDGPNRKWVRGDSRPPCTVPDFQKGFQRNAPEVELPKSAVSQERAALGLDPAKDDDGDGEPDPVTKQERCQALFGKNNCSVGKGVYLVNDGSQITGGIYVKGNVQRLTLKATDDGRQIYRFVQTINQVKYRWTIISDFGANQTKLIKEKLENNSWTKVSEQTYSGVPNGHAPIGQGGPTGQIYVTGQIKRLSGPERDPHNPMPCGGHYDPNNPGTDCPDHPPPDTVKPALSKETQLTITAVDEIGVTGDLTYECDPTMIHNPDYLSQHPRCQTNGQLKTVLGVMSLNEDIVIKRSAPANIYLWGSYLSGAPNRGLAVEDYDKRGASGKMRLFGGLIQSSDQLRGLINRDGSLASGYIETFDYDKRFKDSKLVPPNFPTARFFGVGKVYLIPLTYMDY